MDLLHLLLNFLIALASAKLCGRLFAHLKLPAVLGEVVAGVVFGPSILGWVRIDEILSLLAETGILLLLFEVGLETDIAQLLGVGADCALVAVTGIVTPALLAFATCKWIIGLSLPVSVFVAGTLVATSVGISLRVLRDMKEQESRIARVVLGAAVLDDIAGVLILAALLDFTVRREVGAGHILKMTVDILLFVVGAPILAKLLVPAMEKLDGSGRVPGLLLLLTVSLLLAFSAAARAAGAPAILGAFAAGLALSRHFFIPFGQFAAKRESFAERVECQMRPISALLVPLFFFVVGASINIRVLDFHSVHFWGKSL